jgi:purine-binding chemotaxis protein CheW
MTLLLTSDSGDNQSAAVSENEIEMCSVRVGGALFGVPIMRILEILGAPPTQPVPLAPPYIGGLVHYRGEILTAVSLRSLLGLPSQSNLDMLVFEGRDGYFGLLVDEVGDVMTVSPLAFEANPSTLEESKKALFAGAYKLSDGLLILLDPGKFDPVQLSE